MVDMKLIKKDSEAVVLLEGVLDSSCAEEAEKILRSLVPQYTKLTLDLEKLEYISSAGLRILKILHVDMLKKSGKLVLRNVNDMVMEVFEVTGFTGLLQFEK